MEHRGPGRRAQGDGPRRRGERARTTCGRSAHARAIREHLRELVDAKLAAKEAEIGEADWPSVERVVLLRTIDSLWVEHLTELDDMRRGIGLRGYAQQDPLVEFRREAYNLYAELRGFIRHQLASSILRVQITRQEPVAPQPLPGPGQPGTPAEAAEPRQVAATGRAGREAAAGNAILGSDRPGPAARARGAGREGAARRRGDRGPRPAERLRSAAAGASRRTAGGWAATTSASADPASSTRSATAGDQSGMRQALIRLAAATAVGVLCVAVYGAFRIWQQGLQDETRPAGAVVVLGAAQYNGTPSPIFAARLKHAVDLFETGNYRFLMVTGGKQPGDRTTEAAVARQFAIAHGVPPDRILSEDQGRNTLESLDAVQIDPGGPFDQ